jgi:hypothetical protein
MNAQQKARLAAVPEHHQAVVKRAYAGRSRSAAMKAFCLECVGYIKADVRGCTAKACPLYPYRPYQRGDTEVDE